jgi:hypothetical protein
MRTKMSLTVAIALFAALTLLNASSSLLWSQEVTANIVGTVADPSGAPIRTATVMATDVDRGTVWTAVTNDDGAYNLLRLPVGTYRLKVTSQGFQTIEHAPFTLVLNQTARVDVQMTMGKVSTSVEVISTTPLLQTEATDVSTVIDSNTAESMPLASRDYLQLTLLAPGVTNVDPDQMRSPQDMLNSGRPFINGNREQANEYLIDGVLNSEDKNNEVGYTPNVDAIQEFNLITQNASAEFGNYQGGVVSVSTKSGTNNFHGDLYEFFRSDYLDANLASSGWTQGVDVCGAPGTVCVNGRVPGFSPTGETNKPELRYNQFGATIGGPIIRNKLFFFADFQAQRLVNAGITGSQVLTSQARNGDFGQLCTGWGGSFNSAGICTGGTPPPGVLTQLTYPSGPNAGLPLPNNNLANAGFTIDPVAAKLFADTQYYPLPSLDTLNTNNLFYKSGNDLNNNQGDLKIDYNASQRDHVFGRWSQMDLVQPAFTACVFCFNGAVEGSDEPVRNAVVNWTHTFRSNLLNEARFGFNAVRFNQSQTPTSSLGNISQSLGIAGGNVQAPGLVEMDITGNNTGTASLGLRNLVQDFHSTQGQFEDNLIYTRGRHQIKTGFQFVRERQDYIYPGNNGALGYFTFTTQATGSGLADFWLGSVAGGAGSQRDTGSQLTSPAKLRGNVFAGFVQDDWRVTPTFTVNLGMRFEDHAPLYETEGHEVNFGLYTGTIYTQTGVDGTAKFGNKALYNNYLGIGDWEPRIGLAWAPAVLNGKTVFRAGFAISSFMEGGGGNEELTQNLPFGFLQQQAAGGIGTIENGFPATTAVACGGVINQACYDGVRVRIFDQNFRPATVNQWNVTIQQQFSNTLTFQIGYVGQRGAHLLNFEDVAQSVPLDAQGKIAGRGDPIVTREPGPFLGGATPGSLYLADNPQFNPAGCSSTPATITTNPPCGAETLAGTNMSNSDQEYNALQAVLLKRMGHGLEAQVSYTWSKCMSNSPGYFGEGWGSTGATSSSGQPGWENIYNPRLDWGPCYYDQTHILTSYVTYALPFGHGKQFGHDMNPALNAALGNWEIGGIVTLHSGNALTLNNFGGWGVGGNSDNTNGVDPETLAGLPDCNGPINLQKQTVYASNGAQGFIQWLPNSMTGPAQPAAANTFGTCGVGNVRGPSYANVDLSLHKSIPITENKRLEFRFEALNALNHPVWDFSGGPDNGSFDPGTWTLSPTGVPQTTNPTFGKITGSQGARELQLALKFYF